MSRLRRLFLAPSWIVTVTLILAPLAVVLAYSLLTRGVYGGVTLPGTAENTRASGIRSTCGSSGGRSGLPEFPRCSACCSVSRWRCLWRDPAARIST